MFIKYPHRIYYMSLLSNMTTFKDKLIFGARNTYIHVLSKLGIHIYIFSYNTYFDLENRDNRVLNLNFCWFVRIWLKISSRNNNFGNVMRNFSRETFEKRKGLKKCNWCRTARNLKVCAKTKKRTFHLIINVTSYLALNI